MIENRPPVIVLLILIRWLLKVNRTKATRFSRYIQ